ncbi:MAG: asparagine synthase (glutamine-hydrolyzing) [Candidatus Brocadiia bacterium]
MCGISGWIGPRDPQAAERMRSTIRHRGPDGQGAYEDDSATLLHERLSIIDLAGGRQPMSDESGRYRVIFNGEIYNYREIRGELAGQGHTFRTQSDTEVIVHLYEQMGERCVEQLIGMFAFAIWDSVERTLFLARDRLGIKPLFYAELPGGRFLFASELKAILAHGGVARELDPEGLDQYLTFMYVPAPRTIVRGARKLPPGHTLTVRDGHCVIRRYWELPRAEPIHKGRPFAVEASELRARLQEAVRCRMISDVPLGAYLSGGLDSSLIVALMSLASHAPVNTFSVGFEEHGFDERPYARLVAERFGTNHRELVVRRQAADSLRKIIRALDEPVADSAAIPTYFMAELTKPCVTVVLTGEGADELFAGYSHYKILAWADRLSAVSPSAAVRFVLSKFSRWTAAARGAEYAASLEDRPAAYLALKSVFTQTEKARLYSDGLKASCRTIAPADEAVRRFLRPSGEPYLQQLLRMDLATWLPDDLLVKVDRMTMAHGVEARVPYLDHRVVEAVMHMPPSWKLGGLEGKRILRRVAAGLLPEEIVRRRKTGFAVPVGQWAAGEMKGMVQDLLGPDAVRRRGLFEPAAVARLLNRPRYGMFERRQLWTLICLEMWCREFLDTGGGLNAR